MVIVTLRSYDELLEVDKTLRDHLYNRNMQLLTNKEVFEIQVRAILNHVKGLVYEGNSGVIERY